MENKPPLGPVVIDIEGTSLSEDDCQLLKHELVGGLILFSRNFTSISQLINLVQSIRKVKPNILIAVDHEGGRVQRFKDGFTRIPAMQKFLPLFKEDSASTLQLLHDTGWLLASELLCLQIDISFAPVLDVDDNHSSIIGDRAFSPDPNETAVMAKAFIAGMHEAGMKVTGKHFPGHGSVVEDSHLTLPIDLRNFDQIEKHDLIPFNQLLNECDALMPAHIVFKQVDNEPVGFSKKWITSILKEQLGYSGVIFSDDLSMEGAAVAGSFSDRAKVAMNAGCDSILVCNNRLAALEVIKTLEPLTKSLPFNRLNKMCAHFSGMSLNSLCDLPRWKNTSIALKKMF